VKRRIKQAFTLIELLVVIAIIGILSGLIVVSMNGMTSNATVAKAQIFSNSLRNALMMNLISEWRFDELTTAVQGSTIQDVWSGGNTLTLSTNSDGLDKLQSGNSCVSGKCLSFDGTDDYAYVSGSDATTSNLAITGAITLSAWVKFTALGTDLGIIGRGQMFQSSADYGYYFRKSSDNRLQFVIHSTSAYAVVIAPLASAITNNNWHLITGTWNGTTDTGALKLYMDGALVNSTTSSFTVMGQPAYQFRIGVNGGSTLYPFNGSIDDVRVYNAAIPTSQIEEQYYAGLNGLLASGSVSSDEYASRVLDLNNKYAKK
jgi:prepilin-type N-terminal cleavage/methylation domain-containing protein